MLAILQQTPGFVTVQQLMERLKVSRRTVYYDMDKVNGWLADNGLEPVEYVRGAGFRLPEASRTGLPEQAQRIRPYEYALSPKERKAWMAIVLFTRPDAVFAHDLADFLQVSRMTVLQDMKLLRNELDVYGLTVRVDRKAGYVVEGEEGDKRKALAHYLPQVMADASRKQYRSPFRGVVRGPLADRQPSWQSDEELLAEVYRLVADCETSLGLEFTDETVFVLASRLVLFASRLKQGDVVKLDDDEKAVLRRMPEYKGAQRLAGGLADLFDVRFPDDEVCYLTMHLLGAKLNRLDPPQGGEESAAHGEAAALKALTGRIVDRFEQLACVFFERRAELEEQLFLHIKPAYYRIKYGFEVEHPLLDTMRTKYRELFELTRKAVQPLEHMIGRAVGDDETAFIAMHFGGWLRRQNAEPIRRRKAAIVCVNGISTSRMLRIQLEGLFPYLDIVAVLSLREYEKFRQPVDVLFSTVQLQRAEAPVFVVNAVLSDREKAHLLHEVNRRLEASAPGAANPIGGLVELIKRYADVKDENGLTEALAGYWSAANKPDYAQPGNPSLAQLIPLSRIRFVRKLPDWREAIERAAEPLLEDGYIERPYIAAMIDKVERLGPYIVIAPDVAIAHAKPDEGVLRTGMSLLLVREGVPFSAEAKHRVRALFALASEDGESHLTALSQLTTLLRDEANRERLAGADRAQTIAAMFEQAAVDATDGERGTDA
ncbi:BglG family transcription antiterminator [Paenibacillus sp. GYB003]|uniref:BglG family transcription antiterminator n=1 Tax=Paenibacillus sp. GYB003 TaxID=2994392 RepID=UPI003FA75CB5